MALTPREIVTALPGEKVLMPRQPVPLPYWSALTSRVLALPPHRQVAHRHSRQVVHRQLTMALSPRELALPPLAVQPNNQAKNANRSPNDNSSEDLNPKWVINLSSKPLTEAQRSVLPEHPNFVVIPRYPPNLENIMTIELVCTKLGQQDAEELRAKINRVLRSSHLPKFNLTKAQSQAIRELKRDMDHIVLTVDKGVAMVITDRQDYINKANNLLNQPTNRAILQDPTNTI